MCVRVRARRIISIQNTAKTCILRVLELPTTGRCNLQANRFIRLELLCTSDLPTGQHPLQSNNKFNDPGAKNAHTCRNNVNVTHRSESQLLNVVEGALSPEHKIRNTHCFEYHTSFLRNAFL